MREVRLGFNIRAGVGEGDTSHVCRDAILLCRGVDAFLLSLSLILPVVYPGRVNAALPNWYCFGREG